jgi:hypothetical protein
MGGSLLRREDVFLTRFRCLIKMHFSVLNPNTERYVPEGFNLKPSDNVIFILQHFFAGNHGALFGLEARAKLFKLEEYFIRRVEKFYKQFYALIDFDAITFLTKRDGNAKSFYSWKKMFYPIRHLVEHGMLKEGCDHQTLGLNRYHLDLCDEKINTGCSPVEVSGVYGPEYNSNTISIALCCLAYMQAPFFRRLTYLFDVDEAILLHNAYQADKRGVYQKIFSKNFLGRYEDFYDVSLTYYVIQLLILLEDMSNAALAADKAVWQTGIVTLKGYIDDELKIDLPEKRYRFLIAPLMYASTNLDDSEATKEFIGGHPVWLSSVANAAYYNEREQMLAAGTESELRECVLGKVLKRLDAPEAIKKIRGARFLYASYLQARIHFLEHKEKVVEVFLKKSLNKAVSSYEETLYIMVLTAARVGHDMLLHAIYTRLGLAEQLRCNCWLYEMLGYIEASNRDKLLDCIASSRALFHLADLSPVYLICHHLGRYWDDVEMLNINIMPILKQAIAYRIGTNALEHEVMAGADSNERDDFATRYSELA